MSQIKIFPFYLCGILMLSGCNETGAKVSESAAKFAWPFTIPEGRVECRNKAEVVFVAGSKVYSINGTADAFASQRGYQDVKPIWKDHPTIPGLKINIGPIIEIGLQHC